jgi:HK97 gp10 family phage protein
MIEFDVTVNATEFRQQLDVLAKDIREKAVDAAVRAAAQVFRKAVAEKAPVLKEDTKNRVAGTLKRAIYLKRSKRSTSGARRYFVGIRSCRKAAKSKRDAFYWRFLEAGWMPRGPGGGLRGGARTRALQRRRNLMAGHKRVQVEFIEPAFKAAKGEAEAKFRSAMEKYLAKVRK